MFRLFFFFTCPSIGPGFPGEAKGGGGGSSFDEVKTLTRFRLFVYLHVRAHRADRLIHRDTFDRQKCQCTREVVLFSGRAGETRAAGSPKLLRNGKQRKQRRGEQKGAESAEFAGSAQVSLHMIQFQDRPFCGGFQRFLKQTGYFDRGSLTLTVCALFRAFLPGELAPARVEEIRL